MRWIKCTVLLPEVHKAVLIYMPGIQYGPVYAVGYLENDEHFYFSEQEESMDRLHKEDVSHWMELPEPPND